MSKLLNYLTDGLKNTLLLRNNAGFSFNGPWVNVFENTVLDRFYIGDISSAEYTISADLDNNNKELLKVLVTATLDSASIVIYARNNTARDIVEVTANVNNSFVEVIVSPSLLEDSTLPTIPKIIYSANYFYNQNPHSV